MKHANTQPVAPLPHAIPHAMSEQDVVREHEESLARVVGDHDVHLHIEDGGAVHAAPVSQLPDETNGALLPAFPAAEPHEALPFYRHRVQGPMRTWVRFAFSDLATIPNEEPIAIQTATLFAEMELRRPLTYFEARQLAAAVRDILTSHWIEAAARRENKIRHDEWLADHQEGHES